MKVTLKNDNYVTLKLLLDQIFQWILCKVYKHMTSDIGQTPNAETIWKLLLVI